jgi:hypothetical protein
MRAGGEERELEVGAVAAIDVGEQQLDLRSPLDRRLAHHPAPALHHAHRSVLRRFLHFLWIMYHRVATARRAGSPSSTVSRSTIGVPFERLEGPDMEPVLFDREHLDQQLAGAAHGLCPALEVDLLARDRFDGRELVRVRLEHPHPERHGLTTDEDDAPLGRERLQPAQDALHLLVRKRRLLGHRAR